jgi:methylase of polypeptide subunit release factors
LPYISPEEYVNLETIKCEPKKALISRDKGLDHYRRLSRQLAAIPNNFQTIKAYFEISPWQEKMMINDIFPNSQPIADLSGRTRFIKIDR